MVLKKYRGYTGDVHEDIESGVFYGRLRNIRDLVNYEADTLEDIQKEFEAAVDEYLADCGTEGYMAAERPSDSDDD